MDALLFVFGIVAAVLIGLAWYFVTQWQEQRQLRIVLQYKLVHVVLFKSLEEGKRDWKQEVAVSEQLFSSLADFKTPPVMEIAVHNVGEEIHFYFAVHEKEVNALIQLIQAFWPDSIAELVEDYNIFNPQGGTLIASLAQTREKILPIKTYGLMEQDSLLPLVHIFSSLLKEGDGVALQVVFKKASPSVAKTFKKIYTGLQRGLSLRKATEDADSSPEKEVMRAALTAFNSSSSKSAENELKKDISDSAVTEAAGKKIAKTLFEANARIVVSCDSEARAKVFMDQLASIYPLYSEPKGNALELRLSKGQRELKSAYDYSFRYFRNDQKLILNSEELASIVHLPTRPILEISKVTQLKARMAPPPLELPQEGIVLGTSVYRGQRKTVHMATEDRFRHMYVIGQTGTGKSTFLKNLIKQDIESGNGIAFIDPHGDDAENVLSFIPESRLKDVVYFNPADIGYPMSFNMLEYDRSKPEQRTFIANELIEIIGKIYNLQETGGPMFEQYLKNALFLLMQDSVISPTILDVQRVFSDTLFRQELLARSPDPGVVMFWKKEAEKATGDWGLSNMSIWVNSKLTPFIANDFIKPIIGQEKSSLDFRDIINNKKILIVNLSKGKLGETNAFFLGLLLVGKIFMYAIERDQGERTDFFFYIDEFQNVVTKTIATILSEARKFKLSLNIAHQYMKQIPEDIKAAIFGNVGTVVAFRIEIDDANAIKDYFRPSFTEQDLIRLDNFNAYVRPLIRGKTGPAFNILIDRPPETNRQALEKIIMENRQRYSQPREKVLAAINERYLPVKPPEPPVPPPPAAPPVLS